MKNKLTSASIVARRGIVKLVLDILASASVAKTLISSDDFSSSFSLSALESKVVRARTLPNGITLLRDMKLALFNWRLAEHNSTRS